MENLSSPGMDKLFQIAQRGDVEKFQQLLAEKPFLLHQVPLLCAENPLHFSSAAGHLDFAKEIVKLKPEFARELNPEGFSSLHLASANGHVEIVREIIKVDPNFCRVKGREGKTPFHVAVLTGRVDVINEMLSNCEGCIEDVTVQKETAFHLAVRNCQFGCLQVMLDWIRQMNKEDVLNEKDEHGNTILHLAVWKKQRQVLELLLGNGPGTLEVNAINRSGLTALDLLLIFPSEAGDREIQEILKDARALRAQDLALHITTHSSSRCTSANQSASNLVEYFKFHDGRDFPGEVRGTLLVIAVLVATATYQVGISPLAACGKMIVKGMLLGHPSWAPIILTYWCWWKAVGVISQLLRISGSSTIPISQAIWICSYLPFGIEPQVSRTMENFPMDRLFRIAQEGDVEKLQRLLAEEPLILNQAPLVCTENLLHFPSAAGHLDFAREIVRLKPEFARELNPGGFSSLHLASANGHVEIVREIIRLDPKLCRVKGRQGKTPFHVAVLTGKVDVINEMLSSCEGCIEDVTMQKETAFHLAVRNCQFGSLQVMLDWIRQMNREDILNKKDEHGNTVLHLAVSKKERLVLELLLGNGPGTLEVNAINETGLTALDLLLIFPSEAGDREIQEILKDAGAVRAEDHTLYITTHSSSARSPPANQSASNLVNYFKFLEGRDSPSEVRGTLLVIAVLVATATYQVGISPPGGMWQDDGQGHTAGSSIMGTHNMVSYILLAACNSIGFFVSLYMIETLTGKFPLQTELRICLFALYCTYNLSLTGSAPKSAQFFTNVFTSILPTVIPIIAKLLRKFRVGELVAGIFRRSR